MARAFQLCLSFGRKECLEYLGLDMLRTRKITRVEDQGLDFCKALLGANRQRSALPSLLLVLDITI